MYLLLIFQIMASLLPFQSSETSEENLNKFFLAVSTIESENKHNAKNTHSTASSYFQVTNGTFALMKKRAARMGHDLQDRSIFDLTYNQQRDLIFLDLYQRKGTNNLIRGILQGNKQAALTVYYKYHHTKPDPATLKRAEHIFGEIYG